MRAYTASQELSASQSDAWALISVVVEWPRWLPTVTEVRPLDTSALSVGSRFIVHQPKLKPATWQVTKLEAPRRFTWVSRLPGLWVTGDHELVPLNSVRCRLLLRLEFSGIFSSLAAMTMGTLTQGYIEQEALSAKKYFAAKTAGEN
jgi:hypothetical protein